MTLRIGLVACGIALTVFAFGQSGFKGTVTASGTPVKSARVTLYKNGLSYFSELRTNAFGKFNFADVPAGSYNLGVAALSYDYETLNVSTNGAIQVKNFALQPEMEQGRWDIVGNTEPEFFDGTDIAVLQKDGDVFFCHDTVEPVLFNPVTGTKSFPNGSELASGCMNGTVLATGETIFFGGQEGDAPENFRLAVRYVRAFTPAQNFWRFLDDLQQLNGRWYPGLARLSDGSLLIMGGGTRPDAARTSTCELFNIGTEKCTFTGSMLNPCEFPPTALLYTGEVLATWSPPQLYNTATGQWRATGNFNQPNRGWPDHSDHSIVVLNDGRVVAVGIRPGSSEYQNMVEIYNPSTGTWSMASNPGMSRFQTEVVQLPDGHILSAGGESTIPNPPVENVLNIVKRCDIYDPILDSWRQVAEMNWFREYHAVTLLVPDGRVLMTGGTKIKFQYGPTSADIEAFVPPYLLRGVRPKIGALTKTKFIRGESLTVPITPATKITNMVLMGTESTTHWVSGGVPRRLVIPVTQVGSSVQFKLPLNRNKLPLGNYMMFAMVDDIPSVAKIISVVAN